MGVHFRSIPGAATHTNLSRTFEAYLDDQILSLQELDRGAVRAKNDKAAVSRASHFAAFCGQQSFTDLSFQSTSQADTQRILLGYAYAVAKGEISKSGTAVGLKSVQLYLLAASSFATDANPPLRDPRNHYDACGNRLGDTFFPELSGLYHLMRKWAPPKSQALPVSGTMLHWIVTTAMAGDKYSEHAACADATILGTYTGSRCSEYCRGDLTPGSKDLFSKVPAGPFSPAFADWPIALTIEDFVFLSTQKHEIQWFDALAEAEYVQVRFRFDKGGTGNFSIRTFRRLHQKDPDAVHLYRCPVRTVVRIISRWFFLGKPRLFPVFCYQAKKGKEPRILLADKLSKFLKQCATSVYPDTSHLYRKRIKDIRTHSIRVTACMFLHRAGFSPTFIEHRLRWASDAWKVYLREDFQDIDVASAKVFKAALPTEDTHSDPPNLIYDNVEDDGL
jgi:hypothetical protein